MQCGTPRDTTLPKMRQMGYTPVSRLNTASYDIQAQQHTAKHQTTQAAGSRQLPASLEALGHGVPSLNGSLNSRSSSRNVALRDTLAGYTW
jgi:hypothetical protein